MDGNQVNRTWYFGFGFLLGALVSYGSVFVFKFLQQREESENRDNGQVTNRLTKIPRGLNNLGNTCYFNSIMQSLCHTHAFHAELRRLRKTWLKDTFIDFGGEMLETSAGPFNPENVRNQLIKRVPRFDNHKQHDGHECLRHFLDEIRKEEREQNGSSADKSSLTAVDEIFGGHLVTVYICKECDKHYHLFEPCLDISLPVFFDADTEDTPTNENCDEVPIKNEEILVQIGVSDETNSRAKEIEYNQAISKLTTRLSFPISSHHTPVEESITIRDCLQHFSRVEKIHEEYLCEDCLRKAMDRGEANEDNLKLTSATKQTLIFNPPAVLTIHFKRFELLPGRSKKRSDMVKYPEYLDIAPYCSSQCLRNDPPRNNIWYSLYAVIVHSGSLEFGHYWAYVKKREREENAKELEKYLQQEYFNHNVTSDELIEMVRANVQEEETFVEPSDRRESKWYLVNDSSVSEAKLEDVLAQEAYLLFYERIDTVVNSEYDKRSKDNIGDETDRLLLGNATEETQSLIGSLYE